MKRIMVIIDYLSSSKSNWSKKGEMLIDTKKRHYKKGDMIYHNGKEYIVIEDHVQLRTIASTSAINPYHSYPINFQTTFLKIKKKR